MASPRVAPCISHARVLNAMHPTYSTVLGRHAVTACIIAIAHHGLNNNRVRALCQSVVAAGLYCWCSVVATTKDCNGHDAHMSDVAAMYVELNRVNHRSEAAFARRGLPVPLRIA
eukprot:4803300-Prymnesium_polylepis.3